MSASAMNDAIAKARVIDVHAHCVLEETFGAAGEHGPELTRNADGVQTFRAGHYRMVGARYIGSPFMDPAVRIQRMDEAGIDFQVIGPNPLTYFHYIDAADAIAFCRRHNDAIADVAARHPTRLGALAALPIQDPKAAADELRRAVGDLGLLGAQIGTDAAEPLHSAAYDPLYEAFQALDVPLFLHPNNAGIDGPPGDPNLTRFDLATAFGYAAQETIAVATLIFGGVMERHPSLDICVSHGGGTVAFMAGRLAQAGRKRPWARESLKKDGAFEEALKRFWFDNHVIGGKALILLEEIVGRERLVYGTNFAGWDQPDAGVKAKQDKQLADNARRLLRRG